LDYISFSDAEQGKCSGWYIFRSEDDSAAEPISDVIDIVVYTGIFSFLFFPKH